MEAYLIEIVLGGYSDSPPHYWSEKDINYIVDNLPGKTVCLGHDETVSIGTVMTTRLAVGRIRALLALNRFHYEKFGSLSYNYDNRLGITKIHHLAITDRPKRR